MIFFPLQWVYYWSFIHYCFILLLQAWWWGHDADLVGNLFLSVGQSVNRSKPYAVFELFKHEKKNNSWTDLFFHFHSVVPGIVPIIAKIHFQKQTDEPNWVSWKRREQNTGTGCLLFLLSSSSFLRPFEEKSECKAGTKTQRQETVIVCWYEKVVPTVCWWLFRFWLTLYQCIKHFNKCSLIKILK